MDPKYRKVAGALGLLGAGALIAQVWLLLPGQGLLRALWQMAAAFTILTNLAAALTLLRVAVTGRRASFGWMSMLTLSMMMVGLVYHALLADLRVLTGLAWWVDHVFHTVMPVALLWFWLMEVTRHEPPHQPRTGRPLLWLLWPMGFLAYALVRGHLTGVYAYPFLDIGRLGWGGVAPVLVGIAGAFAALAQGMAALGRRMPLRA
jgi:hypothetical protein